MCVPYNVNVEGRKESILWKAHKLTIASNSIDDPFVVSTAGVVFDARKHFLDGR
jgi:hypothetical protein